MSHLHFQSVYTLNLFLGLIDETFSNWTFYEYTVNWEDKKRQPFSGLTRGAPNSFAESYTVTAERDVSDSNDSRLKHFGNPCCHALGGAADVAVVSRHKLLAFFCL